MALAGPSRKSRMPTATRTVIPGYSEWVANGTLYFEKNGFNARGSVRYRSEFLADFTGFGGSPTRRLARAETIVDAQIGYDFPNGSALDGLSCLSARSKPHQSAICFSIRCAGAGSCDRPAGIWTPVSGQDLLINSDGSQERAVVLSAV